MAQLRCAAAEASGSHAILNRSTTRSIPTAETTSPEIRPTRRKARTKYTIPESEESESDEASYQTTEVPRSAKKPVVKAKTQIRLAPLQSLGSLSDLTIQDDTPERTRRRSPAKQGPRKLLQKHAAVNVKAPRSASRPSTQTEAAGHSRPAHDDDDDDDAGDQDGAMEQELDVEESIWCGSESDASSREDSLPSPGTFFPARRKEKEPAQEWPDVAKQLEALAIFDQDELPAPSTRLKATTKSSQEPPRPGSSSDKENQDAIIRFSPPLCRKPIVREIVERPSTPPRPPASPTKLKSPSKRLPRIPTPPGRPSLNEFWTAGVVNAWNDQYSPQKPLRSPRKLFGPQTKILDDAPIASPAKLQSPSKRSKAEIEARKDWDARKITIAENFLVELDQTITNGEIAELAASTGGVQLIWSKTLNSTAGRANWRRETTKSHSRSDPSTVQTVHKHFASIELAEKVLTYSDDCETKLLNVLAHEFCHLTNFMISGVKDQPHGASFKTWGRQCSRAFRHRGIDVTTKHSYEIEYKYIWKCEDDECGMEFKRHSKSVDPNKHRCGQCKANLIQIKPVPRGGAKVKLGAVPGTNTSAADGVGVKPAQVINGYAAYVKLHFATLKKSLPPSASHKEVMEALGKKYRAEKAAKAMTADTSTADIAQKLGEVKLHVEEVIELD